MFDAVRDLRALERADGGGGKGGNFAGAFKAAFAVDTKGISIGSIKR